MIEETGELIPSFAGGDGGGEAPVVEDPQAEEKELYRKQAEAADLQMQMAKDSKAREEALLPALYKQYGLQMVKNPDGSYSATEAPKTEDQLQSEEVRRKANARTLAALDGKLPIDPSIEADMTRQKAEQDQSLARRGVRAGSGDIYTRARTELDRNQNATRYAIRTGEMTTADALSRGRTADMLARSGQQLAAVNSGRAGSGQSADMLATGSSLYAGAAAPYRDTRFKNADYNYNTSVMNAQGANQLVSGGIGAGGTIIGAALLACWIAEVLYGRWSPQTALLRLWLNTLGERYLPIALGMFFYRRYGVTAAGWIQQHVWAQPPVRWVFDRLYRRACKDLLTKGVQACQI
ncbi:MAG: hypothetical protein KA788_06670 [Lacunisphaera sp.]|nr:hypothetical protein [Lacunisphaera sp.]